MDRRRWLMVGGGLVLVLIVAGGIVVKFGKPGVFDNVPAWLRSHQPAEGIAAQATEPVDPKAAWAACRPSPMVAPCEGQGAGRRVRRTYASSLAASADSLISGSINVSGEVG